MRKLRHLLVCAVLTTAFVTGSSSAQDQGQPESLKEAQHVVAAIGYEQTWEAGSQQALESLLLNIKKSKGFDAALEPNLRRFLSENVAPEMKAKTKQVMLAIAALYQKRFSVDELRSISGFFESSAGKKFSTESAALNREINNVMKLTLLVTGSDRKSTSLNYSH